MLPVTDEHTCPTCAQRKRVKKCHVPMPHHEFLHTDEMTNSHAVVVQCMGSRESSVQIRPPRSHAGGESTSQRVTREGWTRLSETAQMRLLQDPQRSDEIILLNLRQRQTSPFFDLTHENHAAHTTPNDVWSFPASTRVAQCTNNVTLLLFRFLFFLSSNCY